MIITSYKEIAFLIIVLVEDINGFFSEYTEGMREISNKQGIRRLCIRKLSCMVYSFDMSEHDSSL